MTIKLDNLYGYDFVSTEQKAMPHCGEKNWGDKTYLYPGFPSGGILCAEQYCVTPTRELWLQAESSVGKVPEVAPMKDWSSSSADGRYLTGTLRHSLEMSEKPRVYDIRLSSE